MNKKEFNKKIKSLTKEMSIKEICEFSLVLDKALEEIDIEDIYNIDRHSISFYGNSCSIICWLDFYQSDIDKNRYVPYLRYEVI